LGHVQNQSGDVQNQSGGEYTKETCLDRKPSKEIKKRGNDCLPKEGDDVKVEVESSDDDNDIITNDGDLDNNTEDINPLDVQISDKENTHRLEGFNERQEYSAFQEETGIDENYEGYDDNIDDDYQADPLYEEGSSTAINSAELDELICHICRRRFKTKDGLIVHLDTFDHNPFSCDVCGKVFSKKGGLKRHKISHTGERPYSCDLCDKDFKRSHRLSEHKFKIHGTEKKSYTCKVCDKEFFCERNMQLHTVEAHSYEDGLLHCDQCDKTYTRSSCLWYHKKTHLKVNQAEYNCESCVKSFRNKRRLEFHLKKIHGFVKEKNVSVSAKEVLSCEQCEMKFSSQTNLMNHILKHASERQTSKEISDPTIT